MLFTMKSHIIHYKWLKSHEITINSGVRPRPAKTAHQVCPGAGRHPPGIILLHGAAQQSMQGIDAKPSARFSGDGDWILTMISSRCRWICPLFIWIYHDLSMISMTWDMFETTDGCLDGFQQQIATAILGDQQSHGDPTFFQVVQVEVSWALFGTCTRTVVSGRYRPSFLWATRAFPND